LFDIRIRQTAKHLFVSQKIGATGNKKRTKFSPINLQKKKVLTHAHIHYIKLMKNRKYILNKSSFT